jgi:hypothetical protein
MKELTSLLELNRERAKMPGLASTKMGVKEGARTFLVNAPAAAA